MTTPPTCPRCAGSVRAPGLMSSDWQCAVHGSVSPFSVLRHVSLEAVEQLAARSAVPLWLPVPLLPGWSLTGLAHADDRRGTPHGTVVAVSGPSPVGGPADLMLVAEEPRVGLGARYAGLPDDPPLDPDGPPDGKLEAAGHPTSLWRAQSAEDRTVFAGEAKGVWLWLVVWPPLAELLLLEQIKLVDLRDGIPADLPLGAASPYLEVAPGQ